MPSVKQLRQQVESLGKRYKAEAEKAVIATTKVAELGLELSAAAAELARLSESQGAGNGQQARKEKVGAM